jgi:hypothetical protein
MRPTKRKMLTKTPHYLLSREKRSQNVAESWSTLAVRWALGLDSATVSE